MTFCNDTERKFLDLLCAKKHIEGVAGDSVTGELHGGDVVFYDPDKPVESGAIVLAQAPTADHPCYYRAYSLGDKVELVHVDSYTKEGTFPLEDVKITGVVTGIYRELPPAQMVKFEDREEQLFERLGTAIIETVPSSYWPPQWEEEAIYRFTKLHPYDGLMRFFAYGFIKGMRAEKNRRNRAAKGKK